jgi:alpha-ribazole phosphatase
VELIAWRHPRPEGVAGRCIGQVDVAVDRRKTKRLAHRVRKHARRCHLFGQERPTVWTSPLQRCFKVGRVLRGWGWKHHVDPRLSELDFGRWEGQPWATIAVPDIVAWCDDFADGQPGEGESVRQLLARCARFIDSVSAQTVCCVIGHAGWINALRWILERPDELPAAATWPAPLGHGRSVAFRLK